MGRRHDRRPGDLGLQEPEAGKKLVRAAIAVLRRHFGEDDETKKKNQGA